jgi:hypothetical protein
VSFNKDGVYVGHTHEDDEYHTEAKLGMCDKTDWLHEKDAYRRRFEDGTYVNSCVNWQAQE